MCSNYFVAVLFCFKLINIKWKKNYFGCTMAIILSICFTYVFYLHCKIINRPPICEWMYNLKTSNTEHLMTCL